MFVGITEKVQSINWLVVSVVEWNYICLQQFLRTNEAHLIGKVFAKGITWSLLAPM